MRRIKFGIGGAVMLAASLISERGELIVIYLFAALIHELGHLLAARMMKIGVERVEFGFSGVRICVDTGLCSYRSELFLAFFGPLMNFFAIAAALLWASVADISYEALIESGMGYMESGGDGRVGMLGFFVIASFAQAAVNLLPVRSLDGGRILYCTIAMLFGEEAAERVLSVGTAFAAFILWTVALYLMLKVGAGLAVFVFAACIFFSCKS